MIRVGSRRGGESNQTRVNELLHHESSWSSDARVAHAKCWCKLYHTYVLPDWQEIKKDGTTQQQQQQQQRNAANDCSNGWSSGGPRGGFLCGYMDILRLSFVGGN